MKKDNWALKNTTALALNSRHVFSENNEVFLREVTEESLKENEWYPINFQWIGLVALNKTLHHQS